MKKSALLVIDVQTGMFLEEDPVFKGKTLLDNLKKLIVSSRSANTPIFFIQHNGPVGSSIEFGSEGWGIHREITPSIIDTIIQKNTPDSFFHTNLEEELKNLDIDHLIITGIQSEVCVDTTCRRAFSLGYEITLVKDTHSTWDSDELSAQLIINHHNRILEWFAEVKEASEVEFYS
jgi:nicotinamidase-related amidase